MLRRHNAALRKRRGISQNRRVETEMVLSVNTNVGAFIALQNLSATNQQLNVVQNRINTGLKVATAKDNGAVFAIAQTLRAQVGGLNAVNQSLDRAASVADVAIAGGQSIADLLV